MTEVKVQLTSHRRLSVPRFIIMVLINNNNPKMAIKEEKTCFRIHPLYMQKYLNGFYM